MKFSDTAPKEVVCRCPLCGETEAIVFRAPDIVRCTTCGFVYLRERMTADAIDAFYRTVYGVGDNTAATPVRTPPDAHAALFGEEYVSARRMDVLAGVRDALGRRDTLIGLRLLDVGCGWGAMLSEARASDADVVGVELTTPNVAFARSVFGLRVFDEHLPSIGFADGAFDAVTITHTLEHIIDPLSTLREIARILAPGGVCIGRVPNIDSVCSAALGNAWPWLDRDWHYSHFSPGTLRRALDAAGFCDCEITTTSGDYGDDEPLRVLMAARGIGPEEARPALDREHAEGRGEEIRWIARP